MLSDLKKDVEEIKSGQQKVVWWLAGIFSSLVVGAILGVLFQK